MPGSKLVSKLLTVLGEAKKNKHVSNKMSAQDLRNLLANKGVKKAELRNSSIPKEGKVDLENLEVKDQQLTNNRTNKFSVIAPRKDQIDQSKTHFMDEFDRPGLPREEQMGLNQHISSNSHDSWIRGYDSKDGVTREIVEIQTDKHTPIKFSGASRADYVASRPKHWSAYQTSEEEGKTLSLLNTFRTLETKGYDSWGLFKRERKTKLFIKNNAHGIIGETATKNLLGTTKISSIKTEKARVETVAKAVAELDSLSKIAGKGYEIDSKTYGVALKKLYDEVNKVGEEWGYRTPRYRNAIKYARVIHKKAIKAMGKHVKLSGFEPSYRDEFKDLFRHTNDEVKASYYDRVMKTQFDDSVIDSSTSKPLLDYPENNRSKVLKNFKERHVAHINKRDHELKMELKYTPIAEEEAMALKINNNVPKELPPEARSENWLENNINKTLVDAHQAGKQIVKFRIKDHAAFGRGKEVQKSLYEVKIPSQLRKTAKKIGAKYEFSNGFAVITFGAAFSLPVFAKDKKDSIRDILLRDKIAPDVAAKILESINGR